MNAILEFLTKVHCAGLNLSKCCDQFRVRVLNIAVLNRLKKMNYTFTLEYAIMIIMKKFDKLNWHEHLVWALINS